MKMKRFKTQVMEVVNKLFKKISFPKKLFMTMTKTPIKRQKSRKKV